RHAQLLETLARLRGDTERRKRELEQTDAGLHNGDVLGLNPRDGGRSGLPRTAPPRDAGRETRRRAAAPEREPAHERKRGYEGRPREPQRAAARTKDPRAEREARRNEQAGQEPLSRPMIDFVLSEIGRPLPLPAAPPPQSEPWPAPRIQTEPAVPSFVEQARRRAFWELPRMRAGLWVAAGILVLTLAVQVAVGLRDSLVAQHPGVRPLLQALCRPARCQITPWRHLDAVVIDSSALARTGSDAFRFAVTLRNNGAAPVAMPALELALTDALNQPLARRVLSPADWGAPLQLAAHGEFNGTAQLTVGREANPQAVNNYLLSAFYP
ncbi:MAG: DUF3426 domain-containing protein, partial [Burkholderiaceae bacterium]|nr:DUF3426 domain-containing protein [Burkholderiaceae bacterium]